MNCEVCEDTVPCANHLLTFGAFHNRSINNRATRIAITRPFSLGRNEVTPALMVTVTSELRRKENLKEKWREGRGRKGRKPGLLI